MEQDSSKPNDLHSFFEEFRENKVKEIENKVKEVENKVEEVEVELQLHSIVTDFYSFPFLRDQWFIENLKLKFSSKQIATIPEDICNFILELQMDYYSTFINPLFKAEMITALSTSTSTGSSSKCPFARIKTSNTIQKIPPFATESLSRVIYSKIDSVHIIKRINETNGFEEKKVVIRIISPNERSDFPSTDYQILLNGLHKDFKMDDINSNNLIILLPETKICPVHIGNVSACRFSSEILAELCKVRKTLTASDLLFLFPSKVLVINPIELDRFINLAVYMNIFGVPFKLQEIKRFPAYCSKNLEPSFIEPYSDVLSVDFIKENSDLFSFE